MSAPGTVLDFIMNPPSNVRRFASEGIRGGGMTTIKDSDALNEVLSTKASQILDKSVSRVGTDQQASTADETDLGKNESQIERLSKKIVHKLDHLGVCDYSNPLLDGNDGRLQGVYERLSVLRKVLRYEDAEKYQELCADHSHIKEQLSHEKNDADKLRADKRALKAQVQQQETEPDTKESQWELQMKGEDDQITQLKDSIAL